MTLTNRLVVPAVLLPLLCLVLSSTTHAQEQVLIPESARDAHAKTIADKWRAYTRGTFGPRALFEPLFPAAYLMAWPPNHYPRDWRQGIPGLARNYSEELAAQVTFQTARFGAGILLHEDLRYHPSTTRNPLKRAGHALAFTFVDRSDDGHPQPAFANFIGSAAGGYVGRFYLPAGFNDVSHADTRMTIRFGFLAVRNVAEEFSPELLQVSRELHLKIIHLLPEWWTRTETN